MIIVNSPEKITFSKGKTRLKPQSISFNPVSPYKLERFPQDANPGDVLYIDKKGREGMGEGDEILITSPSDPNNRDNVTGILNPLIEKIKIDPDQAYRVKGNLSLDMEGRENKYHCLDMRA